MIGFLTFTIATFFYFSPLQAKQSLTPQGYCSEEVEYSHFKICYEAQFRQASWVKHKLTLEMIDGDQKRTNDYRKDPQIEDPVLGRDYRGSGFDRGHLAPAADFKLDRNMMSESFYMTNMSPQRPRFNRGIWVGIENGVRRKVRELGTAHVITAPILNSGLKTIDSGVAIPDWYYKVAYFPEAELIYAFLIENKRHPRTPLSEFLVPVDQLEELTGFDFFADLPDMLEESLESQVFEF